MGSEAAGGRHAKPSSLETLPDELLLDVLSHLTTARDVSTLGATSRRTHSLGQHDRWRSFVRQAFPSLTIPVPPGEKTDWSRVADRLTYLDRCWEKRAFLIHNFSEQQQQQQQRRGQTSRASQGRQSVSFYPVLDARLLSSPSSSSSPPWGDELVAWGAGQDLITRLKPAGGKQPEQWSRLEGHGAGYASGFGDVTSVSIIERGGAAPEILVGRANGDLALLQAAGDDFGSVSQTLAMRSLRENGDVSTTPSRKSPGQMAISWTEWHPEANLLATCRHSTLMLHDLNESTGQSAPLFPIEQRDLSDDSAGGEMSFVRSAKFLGRDTIACALGGSRRPLRWGKITPTGLELFDAADNPSLLDYVASQSEISPNEKTTVRAIETVGRGSSESLLLSAWDDGTFRLTDIRTPSPHDAIYRDRWNTYDGGSSLVVYGTQRFVAGSNIANSIRFYDFRYPKPYHHTDALPCSPQPPYPPPPFSRGQQPRSLGISRPVHYDPGPRGSCLWHEQSRLDVWRPDATLYLDDGRYARVHALAKASDLSDTFYCGLQGTVAEVGLRLAEDVTIGDIKGRSAPPGWRVRGPRPNTSLSETGVSLCRENEWVQADQGVPPLLEQRRRKPHGPASSNRSRLDSAYVLPREA